MRNIRISLLAAAAVMMVAGPASAATATDDLTVNAEVIASCQITGATLDFGNYDPLSSTDLTSSADLTVTCSQGPDVSITLGDGLHLGGNTAFAAERAMQQGTNSNFLAYKLIQPDNTTVWSSATPYSITPTGVAQTVTVNGLIPAGQNVPVGSYTDTVVATVTF